MVDLPGFDALSSAEKAKFQELNPEAKQKIAELSEKANAFQDEKVREVTEKCPCCMPKEELDKLFAELKADTLFPWAYKKDCCYTRAALMLQRIPAKYKCCKPPVIGKVWAYAKDRSNLIEISGSPTIYWHYHVAPTVKLCDGEKKVIDPSLFDKPVSVEEWLGKMKFVNSKRETDDEEPYYIPHDGKHSIPTPDRTTMAQTINKHYSNLDEPK